MNGRRFCRIALALVAGVALTAGTPALAGGRGGGSGGGSAGMHQGSMPVGGFRGQDGGHFGFRHGGFHRGQGRVVFLAVGTGWPGWWEYAYDGWTDEPVYFGYVAPPTQYVEKGKPATASGGAVPSSWRYYCDQPNGYYPHVKRCPGGWQMEPGRSPS
ncbi:hypothetical protein CYJ10_10315 [Cupriavidus pauculus]|uniref:Uncharacterized protein n=1 Tax=Cupriavidus pauculus TaxID=82633 RepID=A0A2N5CF02_9BURK|nr:hypothetical protein CYJ10_10315 [Cupriavidus pauculus]